MREGAAVVGDETGGVGFGGAATGGGVEAGLRRTTTLCVSAIQTSTFNSK